MKTIYFGHAKGFDYEKELYVPIRSLNIPETQILLPHEKGEEFFSSKELFQKDCDLFIAEVSYPATGLGIELGWANIFNVTIVCISKQGAEISGSLKYITDRFVEYTDTQDMLEKIQKEIVSL